MPKTSIFYYTNNIAPPKLLEHSFLNVIKHCKDNNCELIVTSHFPITKSYTTVSIGNNNQPSVPIHRHIVSDLSIDTDGLDVKNYVVGLLPYSHASIIKQILFSEERCSGDNIILMEHDVLYPDNYIPTVERFLGNRDLTYCHLNIAFLNTNGYFNIDAGSLILSTCAFKRNILKGIYSKKLELINENKPYLFEPLLNSASKYHIDFYKKESIVENHICIDIFLKNKCPLDIKHHLNTDGMLISDNYYHFHPYWGEDKAYIEMIRSAEIDDKNKKLWNYGIGKLNY
jgi:hypothetical protein